MTNNGVTQEKPGGETRKLQELRKGDIVFLDIPFEENTRDYYNGYTPEEIRENHSQTGLDGHQRNGW